MGRLGERVAIVTGGARGIGGATSRRLAEEGAKVPVADIDVTGAAANVAGMRRAGGTAEALRVDVGSNDDIEAMVKRTIELWGRLDVLVNNAYSPPPSGDRGALETSEEDRETGMAMLAKSIFLAAKHAVPEMQKTGGGSIVNIASVHGLLMASGRLVYEAGKAAAIGMTRQMAIDFGPVGIRVNAICPGHIATEANSAEWERNPSGLHFFENQYPLRRVGRPVDVANSVLFLCSDEASFITGHALVADGDLTIQLQEDFGVQQARYIQRNPETRLPY